MPFPTRQTAIVGVGLTAQGVPDRTGHEFAFEAAELALADAGMSWDEVDGVAAVGGQTAAAWWSRQLGRPLVSVGTGSPGAVAVVEAAAYLAAGLCSTVLVVQGQGKKRFKPSPDSSAGPGVVPDWSPEVLAMPMAAWYAQMAQRHMYEFGTTSEQLAEVAATFRDHAVRNPRSIMGRKGAITVADVLDSRMIASPLHLLDCCLDNSGGYAFLVTSAARAQDCRPRPVYVAGGAVSLWNASYSEVATNYYPSPATVTGPAALQSAGVELKDLDVLGIYDCFTITVVRLLEDLGFCALGEGGAFVQNGRLALGGPLPTNTDGGLLSHSHNGAPAGFHVIEVVRQLRRDVEPARQVTGARVGFCHHQGTAVLGRHGSCVLLAE